MSAAVAPAGTGRSNAASSLVSGTHTSAACDGGGGDDNSRRAAPPAPARRNGKDGDREASAADATAEGGG